MQPKTSVRQPVIAGARRQHLSELLRQWRRQPRKRSPLLFWAFLSLALMSDSGLLVLTARLLGVWGPADSALWERLTWDSWLHECTLAPQALYSSLLASGLFAAAAAVRLRWPLWRRRLFFAGLLSCLGCLGWSASVLLGQVPRNGVLPICDGSQGMLWSASVVMGMGLFLSVLFRDAFLSLVCAATSTIGFLAANYWPFAFTQLWPTLPQGAADDTCLRIQVLMLLSAYAALALAWSMAACTLARTLLAAPSNERLRRLAHLCLWPIRIGLVLVAASALLDGWRALGPGPTWHGWDAQAMGTLLVLPGCAALLYARRRGGIPPFQLLTAVMLGFAFLAMMWQAAVLWEAQDLHLAAALADDVGYCMAGLFPLSLAAHAALRYYFGKQRILEV